MKSLFRIPTLLALLVVASGQGLGQDRLKRMPGYERFEWMSREVTNAVKLAALAVTWKDDGRALEYGWDGKRFRYELATAQTTELPTPTNAPGKPTARKKAASGKRPERPARGRQYTSAMSPDGKWTALYRDRNVWLSATNTTNATAVTCEGNAETRIKFGTANWVYGEELFQNTAIWWSPDSRKLAFYRFDEREVKDFFLTLDVSKVQSKLDVEPYMKVGTPNPVVDILIYDLETKQTVTVDVRDGKPFDNDVPGHYVYGVSWTKDSRELLFHRTNRRQNIMEFVAANPATGRCRVVVREEWLPSWTENSPAMQFLEDGRHFLWTSERTGWKNLYLYDLEDGSFIALTRHPFEVATVVRVDEEAGLLYYLARDGDNPMKQQLHRIRLDGTDDTRLTDPSYHHTVNFAPDGRHFIDIAQTHNSPPVTFLRNAAGGLVNELRRSDLTKFHRIRLRPVELLQFKAADGETDLYGMLHFPSGFKPTRKYPLLVSVYAGPATTGAHETFTMPNLLTEFGFLVATFDSRSASGRGKRFLDAIYQKLGIVEMDDQAAGVKSLWNRRYVDRNRVGIYGTSYGGTSAATCLLRFPDVFHAAVANSAVTDYRNYDTIYAERYLWIPQENQAGYEAASVMSYATNLQGRLLLFFGTADNNVHPNNTMQLIQALQKAGKSFEVQVGPDQGHTAVNRDRMMEFFIENLVLRRPREL
jgi:dipeptidyl-peptidase-4